MKQRKAFLFITVLLRTHLTHEQIAQINHIELSSLRKRRYRIKKANRMPISFSVYKEFVCR